MTHVRFWFGLLLLAGCSGGSDANDGQGTAGASAAGANAAGANAAGASAAGASTAGAGGSAAGANAAGAGGSAAGAGGTAPSLLDAPDNAAALVPFLDAKQYAGWAKEAAYHASTGPHGDGVRVFYSPKAAAALRSGATTFPAGAAVVKELSSGGSLYGFAVWVKVQGATDSGKGFYWYEIIHQGGGKDSIYGDALGSDDCVGCHSAGKDYDLSTMPFE